MTTKITQTRGRPNATQIIDTSTSPLISNIATTLNAQTNGFQQQFVPSLLRIESVVPTRLNANRFARVNRVITRSYSTLCGTTAPSSSILGSSTLTSPFSLSNGLAGAIVPAPTMVNYKNVTKRINTNLQQRHKTNHHHQRLDGNESPQGKINNNGSASAVQAMTSETCCIMVENGIQKVRRTMKEKEKQPDRISLDRRGLCTIPIIDNEPSLRLLSLQHNLINTFNIPDSELGANNNGGVDSPDGDKDNNNNNLTSLKEDKLSSTNESAVAIINKAATTTTSPPKPFLKQRSISRNQLNLNFSANNNATISSAATTTTPTSSTTPGFLQKQFVFAPSATKHGLLKRANSVMINYSPTLSSSPALLVQQQRGKLVATPSFSSVIDTGTHHEPTAGGRQSTSNSNSNSNSPDIQIDASNSYLRCFRFNLTNLVFLDLYNNQIEKISNLDGLKSLTVLLLGKNRITDISGIVSLRLTLRVLDLHGNRISNISKISQLQELKSLNLAGNQLRCVQPNDFAGLQHLKELNLKRNRIKRINFSDDLHCLER